MRRSAVCALAGLLFLAGIAQAETHRYIPKREELKYVFGVAPPVLKIKPGDIVETWTEDAYSGSVKKPGDHEQGPPNPQTGPFYIEGAEPGDTLVVHLIKLEPASDQGVGSIFPGFGALTGTEYTPTLDQPLAARYWFFALDRKANTATFRATDSNFEVKIPLHPFLGCIGTAPENGEVRSTIVPEAFGGNMDAPEARADTTVYLPVNVRGALLYIGDGHAAQGEGEFAGTAIEVPMNVRFAVDLIKGQQLAWPRFEDDRYIMAAGSYRPLEDAFRIAYLGLIEWIAADYDLSKIDAYELLSKVSETKVTELVDPNYTVIAKVAKTFLPPRKAGPTPHERWRESERAKR